MSTSSGPLRSPLPSPSHELKKSIIAARLPDYTTTRTSPRSPTKQSFAPRNGRWVAPGFELVEVADDNVGPKAWRMCTGIEGASAAVMPTPDVVRDKRVLSSPSARYFNACRTAIAKRRSQNNLIWSPISGRTGRVSGDGACMSFDVLQGGKDPARMKRERVR
jgi:hypothetical protein